MMKVNWKRLLVVMLVLSMVLNGCSFDFGGGKADETEEILLGHLTGGVFYNNTALAESEKEAAFIAVREEGTDRLKEALVQAWTYSQPLTDAYSAYENLIKDFLSDKTLEEKDLLLVQIILNDSITYRSGLEANETMIGHYLDAAVETEVAQSVLDSYIMESSHNLYRLHTEYMDLMAMNTGVIASMFEETDPAAAAGLLEKFQQVMTEEVADHYGDYMASYSRTTEMVVRLASGDYYVEEAYLNRALDTLNQTESTETVEAYKAIIEERLNNRIEPDYLVEISAGEANHKTVTKGNWLIGEVHADDLDDIANGIAAVQMIKEVSAYKGDDKEGFKETAVSNMLFNIPNIKTNLQNMSSSQLQAYQDMSPTQRATAYANAMTQTNPQAVPAASTIEPGKMNVQRDYSKYQNAIDIVNRLRGAKDGLGSFLGMEETDKNKQFGNIILGASAALFIGKGEFDEKTRSAITQFLKSDFEEILGDKRGVLVDTLLNNSAEDFIDTYLDWKDSTNGFKDLNFQMADIRSSLDQLGLRPEDFAGIVSQLMHAYENEASFSGIRDLLNLPQMIMDTIWGILEALSFGLITREEEAVESGVTVKTNLNGDLTRTNTYANNVVVEQRNFKTKEGQDNVGSYKVTYNDDKGNALEEVVYDQGMKTRHDYYIYYKGNHQLYYRDFYENGVYKERKYSLNPDLLLRK